MKHIAYVADKVFTGEAWLQDHAVIVKDNKVQSVIPTTELDEAFEVKSYPGCFLAPAFIDIQIYGAHQKLLSVHPTADALHLLQDYCFKGGATLCVPTVATNAIEVFKKCIDAVNDYWNSGGKGVYGLHLEGPWIMSVCSRSRNTGSKNVLTKRVNETTITTKKTLM